MASSTPFCPPQVPPIARLRIKYCGASNGHESTPGVVILEREILPIIDEELELFRRPFDRVNMELLLRVG